MVAAATPCTRRLNVPIHFFVKGSCPLFWERLSGFRIDRGMGVFVRFSVSEWFFRITYFKQEA